MLTGDSQECEPRSVVLAAEVHFPSAPTFHELVFAQKILPCRLNARMSCRVHLTYQLRRLVVALGVLLWRETLGSVGNTVIDEQWWHMQLFACLPWRLNKCSYKTM